MSDEVVEFGKLKPMVWRKNERDDIERYRAETPLADGWVTWTASGWEADISFWGSAGWPRLGFFTSKDEAQSAVWEQYVAFVSAAFDAQTPPLLSQEEAFQRAVKAGMWNGLVSKPEEA